ncbi:hypothetical protein H7Y21_03310 [Arenimonas sp.]|nr:hypothetical protein [Candidatus Parcubacteria bacterium]
MNIFKHKNIILIIIIVLLAFFGYWFFFLSKKDAIQTKKPGQGLTTQASPVSSNTPYDKEFVSSLLGLNSVNLDVSVFQSRVYQALSYPEIPFVVDYTRDAGRANPFLPIGVDAVKNTNTSTQVNESDTNSNPSMVPVTNATDTAPVSVPARKTTTKTTPKSTPKTTPASPTVTPQPKTF